MVRPSALPKTRLSRGLCFRAVGASLVLLGAYFLLQNNIADSGLWSRLAFGALLAHGGFPSGDVLSFTAEGSGWVNPTWGSAALFYRLLTDWGDAGLFVLKLWMFVAALLTASGIYQAATRDRDGALPEGVSFAVGAPSCWVLIEAYGPTVSPAIFGYLAYLSCLWVLTVYRLAPETRAPWLLPPLFGLWVNFDEGFLFGLLAVALHVAWFAAERHKKQAAELAVVSGFSLGALLLNPYGWTLLLRVHPFGAWENILASGDASGWLYAVIAAATISAAAVNARDDRRFPGTFFMLSVAALAGGAHSQLAPYFLLTAVSLGSVEILRLVERYRVPPRLRDTLGFWAPAAVAVVAGFLFLGRFATSDQGFRPLVPAWNSERGQPAAAAPYPIGAAAYLSETGEPARVWCPREWGGFLSWSLYPQVRVSLDARLESVYPHSVVDDHFAFWKRRTDAALPEGYGATHIIAPADNADAIAALDASTWSRAYEDPIAVLYVRESAGAPASARPNQSAFVGELLGDVARFD